MVSVSSANCTGINPANVNECYPGDPEWNQANLQSIKEGVNDAVKTVYENTAGRAGRWAEGEIESAGKLWALGIHHLMMPYIAKEQSGGNIVIPTDFYYLDHHINKGVTDYDKLRNRIFGVIGMVGSLAAFTLAVAAAPETGMASAIGAAYAYDSLVASTHQAVTGLHTDTTTHRAMKAGLSEIESDAQAESDASLFEFAIPFGLEGAKLAKANSASRLNLANSAELPLLYKKEFEFAEKFSDYNQYLFDKDNELHQMVFGKQDEKINSDEIANVTTSTGELRKTALSSDSFSNDIERNKKLIASDSVVSGALQKQFKVITSDSQLLTKAIMKVLWDRRERIKKWLQPWYNPYLPSYDDPLEFEFTFDDYIAADICSNGQIIKYKKFLIRLVHLDSTLLYKNYLIVFVPIFELD